MTNSLSRQAAKAFQAAVQRLVVSSLWVTENDVFLLVATPPRYCLEQEVTLICLLGEEVRRLGDGTVSEGEAGNLPIMLGTLFSYFPGQRTVRKQECPFIAEGDADGRPAALALLQAAPGSNALWRSVKIQRQMRRAGLYYASESEVAELTAEIVEARPFSMA